MQLDQLVKPMDDMTDEELLERLRQIRHNRTVIRPAALAHKKKAVTKGSQGRVSKLANLTAELTPEQKAALIAQLTGG